MRPLVQCSETPKHSSCCLLRSYYNTHTTSVSIQVTDTSKVAATLRSKMLFPSRELKPGVNEFDVYLKVGYTL